MRRLNLVEGHERATAEISKRRGKEPFFFFLLVPPVPAIADYIGGGRRRRRRRREGDDGRPMTSLKPGCGHR